MPLKKILNAKESSLTSNKNGKSQNTEKFNVLSRFIENSKSYNDSKIELLKKVNDCILEKSAEKLQQKNLFDF